MPNNDDKPATCTQDVVFPVVLTQASYEDANGAGRKCQLRVRNVRALRNDGQCAHIEVTLDEWTAKRLSRHAMSVVLDSDSSVVLAAELLGCTPRALTRMLPLIP